MGRIAHLAYPQDFIEEAPARDWWAHKPTARAVASKVDRWQQANISCAAILLARQDTQGLALEWAQSMQRRFPYEVDTLIKIERTAAPPAPKRAYSASLPPLRDPKPKDTASTLADLFSRAPPGSRGL